MLHLDDWEWVQKEDFVGDVQKWGFSSREGEGREEIPARDVDVLRGASQINGGEKKTLRRRTSCGKSAVWWMSSEKRCTLFQIRVTERQTGDASRRIDWCSEGGERIKNARAIQKPGKSRK